ncbi:phosphoribosyltransferase [Candidatus Woesearchaeota archaeon]|nr:phosphoribosyltransferase [Candidatus Woesearchaeota archaeon]
MEKHHVSFEELVTLCKELAEKVRKSKFKPDVMIGISRGGWVPARFLSEYLGVELLASIGVKSYDDCKKHCKPYVFEDLGLKVKGLKVLVVDEVVDTGESLEVVKEYLDSFSPSEVKFAVLHCKPWSKFKPDFSVRQTDKWVVYPWGEK